MPSQSCMLLKMPRKRLERLLRPACGGIYTVSTGTVEQRKLQRRIYGAESDEQVGTKWRAALDALPSAKVAILGVPSDVGAGFLRGANMGPQAMRRELLGAGSFLYEDSRVVDIG